MSQATFARAPQTAQPRPRRSRRFPSLRAIIALMLREMATTYGRSPGGYFWAVAEPVAGVFVLTWAFSFIFMMPPLGTSFELFYATGMLPFTMFATISNRVGTSLVFSKPLLTFPAVTYVDAIAARFLLNLLTELLVIFLVFLAILSLFDTRALLDAGQIAESLGLTALFALAVGTANAYLFMRFPVWHVFWALINRPLFVISGVFFIYDKLPALLKDWLWYNPLVHVVGTMRKGFYPTYDNHYVSPTYVIGVSLVLLLFGFLMLSMQGKRLLQEG
jgi:capsular polysaccharide transport system permease protein